MRRLNGFSLAEVLITLTIIGVIASLTLPNLSINVQKQQVGPILAKSINNLENANRMLLQNTYSRNIAQACNINQNEFLADAYLACLQAKDIMILSENNKVIKFYNNNDYGQTEEMKCYDTNDGMSYCTDDSELKSLGANELSNSYYGKYTEVYIDINGVNKKPNIGGKDVFKVLVDLKGAVIPFGGAAEQKYLGLEEVVWKSDCTETIMGEGYTCTGSIADHGWKVEYNY